MLLVTKMLKESSLRSVYRRVVGYPMALSVGDATNSHNNRSGVLTCQQQLSHCGGREVTRDVTATVHTPLVIASVMVLLRELSRNTYEAVTELVKCVTKSGGTIRSESLAHSSHPSPLIRTPFTSSSVVYCSNKGKGGAIYNLC